MPWKKIALMTSLTLGFQTACFADGFGPAEMLAKIEDSLGSMSMPDRLQTELNLAHYYERMKLTGDADRLYQGLVSTIETSPVRDVVNDERIGEITERIENEIPSSDDPALQARRTQLQRITSEIRANVIQRALNDPDGGSKQNKDANSLGLSGIAALAGQLSSAPEFNGLFVATVRSFSNGGIVPSVSRARELAEQISTLRKGNRDRDGVSDLTRLESDLEDANAELKELSEKVVHTQEDADEIENLKSEIDSSRDEIHEMQSQDPCFSDIRSLLDQPLLKDFTCATASLAFQEGKQSREAVQYINMVVKTKPYSSYLKECDLQINEEDWAKANLNLPAEDSDPSKCKVPDYVEKLGNQVSFKKISSPEVEQLFFKNDFARSAESSECAKKIQEQVDYLRSVVLENTIVYAQKIDLSTLNRIDSAANMLPDKYALKILSESAEKKLALADVNHADDMMVPLSNRMAASQTSVQSINKGTDSLSYINHAVDVYIQKTWNASSTDSLWDSYTRTLKLAENIRQTPVQDFLLLHIVEKFAQMANPAAKF